MAFYAIFDLCSMITYLDSGILLCGLLFVILLHGISQEVP